MLWHAVDCCCVNSTYSVARHLNVASGATSLVTVTLPHSLQPSLIRIGSSSPPGLSQPLDGNQFPPPGPSQPPRVNPFPSRLSQSHNVNLFHPLAQSLNVNTSGVSQPPNVKPLCQIHCRQH